MPKDAILMMEWLLDPAGGNVPEQNLILLLSPEAKPELDPLVARSMHPAKVGPLQTRLDRQKALGNRRTAGFDGINKAIIDIHAKAGEVGERLFFHYSG